MAISCVRRELPDESGACDISGLECFIIILLFVVLANIAGVDAGLIGVEALVLRLFVVAFIHGLLKFIYIDLFPPINTRQMKLCTCNTNNTN